MHIIEQWWHPDRGGALRTINGPAGGSNTPGTQLSPCFSPSRRPH